MVKAMSESLRIICGNDIPTAARLRELVADDVHVVLQDPQDVRGLVERLAAQLPEFTVFDSGGAVTVKKVILTEPIIANAAGFLSAMRLFRDTASQLVRRLA